MAAYELCSALASLGVDVHVLTTDANGSSSLAPSATAAAAVKFPVSYCKRVAGNTISVAMLQQMRPAVEWADVVHLHGVFNFPTLPTLAAARTLKRPIFWSVHGSLQSSGKPRLVKRLWLAATDLLASQGTVMHFASELEARASIESSWSGQYRIIGHGVRVPDALQKRRGDVLRVLFVGRLHPIKGIERLIEACALSRQEHGTKLSLTIAGTGDAKYVKGLRTLVTNRGLANVVTFAGLIEGDRQRELYEMSDVLVMPSDQESFGLVAAEALAHGVPVVASKATPWEGLETMGCGWWRTCDPHDLAAVLKEAATVDLLSMGERGRAWMLEAFSWEAVATSTLDAYRALVISEPTPL